MDRIKKAISSTAKKVTSAVRSLGSSSLTASAVKATPPSSSALSNLIQKARPVSKTTPAPTTTAPMTMAPMTPSQAGIRQTLVPTMSTALGPAAVADTGQTVIYGRGGPVVFEAGNVPTTGLDVSGAPTTIQRQGTNTPATKTSNITTPLLTNEPLTRTTNVTSETISEPTTGSVVMPTSTGIQNVGTVNNAGLVNMMANAGFDYVPETNQFVARPMEGANKEQQIQSLTGQISDLVTRALPKRERVSEDPLVQAQREKVEKARQELANYTGQLNAITAKQQADLLTLRGVGSREGVTEIVYGGQAAAINREAAIQALPIQAQIATAQGNVQLAQDYLKLLIDEKKEEIDNNYEYNKAVYTTIKDYADTNQKRILDRISKEEDRAFELQKSNLSALARAYENVAGDANAIGRLRNINTASPNASLEIANIVGQTKQQTGQTRITVPATTLSKLRSIGLNDQEAQSIQGGVASEGLRSVVEKELMSGSDINFVRNIATAYEASPEIFDLIDQYETPNTTEEVTGLKNWWNNIFTLNSNK